MMMFLDRKTVAKTKKPTQHGSMQNNEGEKEKDAKQVFVIAH